MTDSFPFPWSYDGSRYSDHYLMSKVTEARVQADIIEVLELYSVDAVAIDAGGRRQRGRMMGAAKKAGVDLATISNAKTWYAIPAGFADLEATLAPHGRALYIEVKAPAWIDAKHNILRRAGEASAQQLEFLLAKHRRGALVLVAWSAKDVEDCVAQNLRVNRRAVKNF